MDGGPYPASSAGPIHTFANVTTWVKGRHTFKGGVQVEYSGEDDFDQINVSAIPGSTNNQNGRFEFLDGRAGGTNVAIANAALGLYSNYAELGQRNFTAWRSLATDVFVQDSWKPTSQMTIEGGVRWVLWPPWYSTTNNIANFDPNFYDPAQAPIVNPANGALTGGNRYNGIVLPGDGFEGDGGEGLPSSVNALFRGEPRGFSDTHYNVFEPRLGATYQLNEKTILRLSGGIFHYRVTLNDSTLLGGNPPFQPQATVSNGLVDNPGGGTASASLPFGINGQDVAFKHPTAYMWGFGIQREIPFGITLDVTYLARRGLYLQRERNINQLQPGQLQANPGVNIAALRPYAGYNVIRLTENSGKSRYNSLQVSADRRYRNGLKLGFAYTYGKSEDNASNKRTVLWNTLRRHEHAGAVGLRPPPRGQRLLHLRPAVLARPEHADAQPARRLAGVGRDVLPHRHAVRRAAEQRHRGRGRRRLPAAGATWSATSTRARTSSSRPPSATATTGSTRRRLPTRRPAPSATRRATSSTTPASSSGTSRSSRTSTWAARAVRSSGPSSSTSRTTRTGPTSRRVHCRARAGPIRATRPSVASSARRASARAQLSLRFIF